MQSLCKTGLIFFGVPERAWQFKDSHSQFLGAIQTAMAVVDTATTRSTPTPKTPPSH
jgi:hypothetical protein